MNLLSIDYATSKLYSKIEEYSGWKFLKSKKCLKKTVNDLVFQIDFYSSKWNTSHRIVDVNCELKIWCKKFDNKSSVNSSIGFIELNPKKGEWYDISTEEKLESVINEICNLFDEKVKPLIDLFEEDFNKATIYLMKDDVFKEYNINLDFVDKYAGREYIIDKSKDILNSLSPVYKEDIIRYKEGARDKMWMINRCNLKYIIDNNIV